ncbi:epoxyqueuosine reductase QueH [uncultured Eubacterium sp.]|uniref:epoxyqueuosine reductase QueH n=1 Tax=uncultured Eubacterium sp. TaxID=165185 RepID=UPI0028062BEB|nr:epoxyqueuosine reductase QueH [uncultured Eubacterium sp.]
MNKINYQKELDKIIDNLNGEVPKLFLHSCCAPCSSYTLEYLSNYFDITVYYFNPNISPKAEFDKRYAEQKRLIEALPSKHPIKLVCGEYDYNDFLKIAKGYEDVPEGGERCFRCYRMRLESTAKLAKEQGFDYFCTTLSISPLKNSQKINEIGYEVAEKYGIKWLPSDFKKKEGYKRSIELSREYQLYRQNFCGCIFSKENKDE